MVIRSSKDVYVIGRDNAKPFLVADMPVGRDVILMQPLSFTIPDLPIFGTWRGLEILVPSGFISDYASVPRLFWRLIPRRGPYNKAAFIHDFLYVIQRVPRYIADLVFLFAMRALGVVELTARVMFRAVRAGGWFGWRRNAKLPSTRLRLHYGLHFIPRLFRPVDHPEWEFKPV